MTLILTRGVTIAANESLGTLGPKLAQLVDLSTLSGLSQSDATLPVVIPQSSTTTPAGTTDGYMFAVPTNMNTDGCGLLNVYGGSSTQKRWEPISDGPSLKNTTGGARGVNEIVCISSGTAALSADSFCFTGNIMVGAIVEASVLNNAYMWMRNFGIHTFKCSGSVARGDYVGLNTANSTYQCISFGATLDGAFGVAIGPSSGGQVGVLCFGHNKI